MEEQDNIQKNKQLIADELREIAPELSRLKAEMEPSASLPAADVASLKASILAKTVGATTEETAASEPAIKTETKVRRLTVYVRAIAVAASLVGAFFIVKSFLPGDSGAVDPIVYESEFDRLFASLSDEELAAIVSNEAEAVSLTYIEEAFGETIDDGSPELDWTIIDEVDEVDFLDLIDTEDLSDSEIELFL